jgi:selenocysteine lyase/cysteine desulfurase
MPQGEHFMTHEVPRREFLASLGLASTAGLAGCATTATGAETAAPAAYGFAPGLTYLNTASLGPTPRTVFERTMQAWREIETNPVRQAYGAGAMALEAEGTRQRAAGLLGCDGSELLITRCTTEAMTSIAQGIVLERGDRVLTTNHEHHGGEMCWQYLQRKRGVEIDVLRIPLTEHDPSAVLNRFDAAITRRTRVISVSHVLTTNGLRMPIAEIATLARARSILCVVDGAQAIGEISVDLHALGCHAYAGAGHKWLMGPKGTGFLYISADAADRIEPLQRMDGVRFVSNAVGMGPVPLVVGLGAAIDAMQAQGMASVEQRILELRERVYQGLSSIGRLQMVSPPTGPTASALVAAQLPAEIEARPFQRMLRDRHNLIVKRVEEHYFNGIRLSPHVFNTEAEIDFAISTIRNELA